MKLDGDQERKLELLLSLMDLPQKDEEQTKAEEPDELNQPRDQSGRFASRETEFQYDSDKFTWVHCGNGTYVRRRKARYVAQDILFIAGLLAVVAIVV